MEYVLSNNKVKLAYVDSFG